MFVISLVTGDCEVISYSIKASFNGQDFMQGVDPASLFLPALMGWSKKSYNKVLFLLTTPSPASRKSRIVLFTLQISLHNVFWRNHNMVAPHQEPISCHLPNLVGNSKYEQFLAKKWRNFRKSALDEK